MPALAEAPVSTPISSVSAETFAASGPRLVTPLPGPKAAALIARDEALLSPSYTRSYPLTVASALGAHITDLDGNRFLDLTAGIAVTATGHCHPQVVAAIQQQAASLIHMSGTDFYYQGMPALAQRLSDIAPMPGPHRVYFGNSGAEAVECALKLARYHTGRQHIIAFLGAFHGRTMGALSLTASRPQQRRRFAPLVPGVTHIPYPNLLRGCPPHATPQQQHDYALACATFLEDRLFKTTLPPEEVAAIVVEPIQGEGGYLPAPPVFLQELRRIADRHGILLIVDEVQSGIGRTGQWWAVQHSGVQPDIVTSAKGLASGMPLSACIARAHIMDWVPGSHASTFGGNPVAIAAALATLEVLEREGLANAAAVGHQMLQRMSTWPARYPIVAQARGRGLMLGLEITHPSHDGAVGTPNPTLRDALVDAAFHRGLLLLGCGESSLRLSPSLLLTPDEATIALDLLETTLAAHS